MLPEINRVAMQRGAVPALLLALSVCLLPAAPRAEQDATPATPASAPLDLGDCPDTPAGFQEDAIYTCTCPAKPEQGTIYGTDIYTNDSNICVAAAHAGLLRSGSAGQVVLKMVASPPVFKGRTQNGIKSLVWPKPTGAAFEFVRAK